MLFFVLRWAVVSFLTVNALMFGTPIEETEYYKTPEECIDITVERVLETEYSKEDYNIDKEIYTLETDKYYYTFYLAKDKVTLWYFVLEKVYTDDGVLNYKEEDYAISVQYHSYKWYEIPEAYYRIADSSEKITNCNGNEPVITEYQIDTIHGKETRYLLFSLKTGDN